MGKDIFGNELLNLAGAFTADEGIITFPALGDNTGIFMIQTITISQAQNVNVLYDLASRAAMLVKGRPTFGQVTFSQIVGPKVDMEAFFTQFADICNAPKNIIDITLSKNVCENDQRVGKKISLRLFYCFIANYTLTSDVASYQIRQDVNLFFCQMAKKTTDTE